MSVYLICDVRVKDREALSDYLALSTSTLELYGGVFRVQAGDVHVIEGEWNPTVIIVAEFPSVVLAKRWYNSAEYADALVVKDRAMDRNLIFVEGVDVSDSEVTEHSA